MKKIGALVIAVVLFVVLFVVLLFDDEECEAPEGAGTHSGSTAKPESMPPANLTSGFGARWGTMHNGVDLATGEGTPIYAYADGVVVMAGPATGYGLWIVIDHQIDGKRVSTVYGHMFKLHVTPGQTVTAGQHIADEGYNGSVVPPGPAGSHLHFEYYPGGFGTSAPVDPQPYVEAAPNVGGGGGSAVEKKDVPPAPGANAGQELPPTPSDIGSEANLQKDTVNLMRMSHNQFPDIQSIGGWRQDPYPDHPSGRAIDIMIPNWDTSEGQARGTEIKNWLYANREELNIDYMIWQQEYIPASGTGNVMEDRGSPTQNHFDHIHITTYGGGYPDGSESYTAIEGTSTSGSYDSASTGCENSGKVGDVGKLAGGSVPEEFQPWLNRAGGQCEGVDAPLLAAQLQQESNWQKGAVSPAGAQGYSQFMPDTWAAYGYKVDENGKEIGGPGSGDPNNVGDAVMAQARYMCAVQADIRPALESGQISGDLTELTLAAYNAGPGAVLDNGGIPPYAETQGYVTNIMASRENFM